MEFVADAEYLETIVWTTFRIPVSCAPRCIHLEFLERERLLAQRGQLVIGFTNGGRAMGAIP